MEIVNPVDPAELEGWTSTLRTSFLRAPDPDEAREGADRWRRRLEPARTWGARDGGRWVATLATDARRLTVPGPGGGTNDVPIDALTAVTVSPSHRRRGLLTGMLTASLAAAKERGDAMSYLIAAEWPIYGRFGYAPATQFANYTYFPRARGGAVAGGADGVRFVEPAELAEVAPEVFERARRARPGEVDKLLRHWTTFYNGEKAATRFHLAVHDGPDGVDGVLIWKPTRDFELGHGLGALEVEDLFAATPDAYRALWAFLSGVDVIDEISISGRPTDEPARWLLGDGRALRTTFTGDFTWLALLDVPAALTARSYDVTASLVIEIVDPSVHGYAAGRYALDAAPDGASCTPTTRTADVTVSAHALASAYLGGYRLGGRAVIGDVEEHTPGAAHRLDVLLAGSVVPYCGSGF